jgi:gamma-glutamyl-gamma-aminobutyrate hydrolase PuuD
MKIAITQRQVEINGFVYDCLEQGWYNFFLDHEVIPVPNLSNIGLDVDMLVISGGETTEDRYQTEVACAAWALENDLPILGVCHGAFLLNYLFTGINAKELKGHHNTYHKIQMEDEDHLVNSYHHMSITELGFDLEPIAYCGDLIEGFKHTQRDIWGLVWHPERMEDPVLPSDLRKLIYG